MTTIVAIVLTALFLGLKDRSDMNEAIFNKRAILSAVKSQLGDKDPKNMSDEEVLDIFTKQVKQIALDMSGNEVSVAEVESRGYKGGLAEHIDMKKEKKKAEEDRILPLYIFDTGSSKVYIVSIRGSGLWDDIWGNIALDSDLNTIVGAAFDHQGETPGLGAEIKDNPSFPNMFKGKKIYDNSGKYVSIAAVKGGTKKEDVHEVDVISGATVTSVGVSEMMKRGIKYYEPYFNKLQSK
jgi:Na+-transporting NADH:ubiquinone oxidoreductase subunit C